jgi:hypothetical protein
MAANVKGRLNFSNFGTVNSQHVITLVDSQPFLTLAATLNRPPAVANDTYIGLDQGNVISANAQLAFGAPVAISNYIANTGDNTNWGTRLNSSGFAVGTHLNQRASANFAGTCVFSASASCSISYSTGFAQVPVVILTPVNPGSVTFTLTSTGISGFTVTASSSNSLTVNWLAIGNPN